MHSGLERHGITPLVTQRDTATEGDAVIVWGWRQKRVIEHCERTKTPLLVMELGHLQDRMHFTSLGWGGLANRGLYPAPDDNGVRFRRLWPKMMKPWRKGTYVLLCGQCEGDASLAGMDHNKWAQTATAALLRRGERVVYRPHPLQNKGWCPLGAERSQDSLSGDLSQASFAVTYNSTVGVEAVMAGVPTVTFDAGSMAWPVTSHSIDDPLTTPDRDEWAHRLAWCQWTPDEIESGEAWATVREAMPT